MASGARMDTIYLRVAYNWIKTERKREIKSDRECTAVSSSETVCQ